MRTIPARWQGAVLVCGKCSKKVGGGFGDKGGTPLVKALRKYLRLKKGRKSAAGVVEVKCLGLCPKRMIVAIDANKPEAWRLVVPGSSIDVVASELGLGHPHPSVASLLPPPPIGKGKGPAAAGGGKGEGDTP